jgi:phage terminase large subunit GpA-like protein
LAAYPWAKRRERLEALDCAVLARALWLLGADRYGERFWAQLREQVANAQLRESDIPAAGTVAPPPPPVSTATHRPLSWLAPRAGWLR